ncbi:hypothetical protein L1887_16354 [Cichorium endivia]|nr:hypothetical protein L1887_16354 [Cichorium endivia]
MFQTMRFQLLELASFRYFIKQQYLLSNIIKFKLDSLVRFTSQNLTPSSIKVKGPIWNIVLIQGLQLTYFLHRFIDIIIASASLLISLTRSPICFHVSDLPQQLISFFFTKSFNWGGICDSNR